MGLTAQKRYPNRFRNTRVDTLDQQCSKIAHDICPSVDSHIITREETVAAFLQSEYRGTNLDIRILTGSEALEAASDLGDCVHSIR